MATTSLMTDEIPEGNLSSTSNPSSKAIPVDNKAQVPQSDLPASSQALKISLLKRSWQKLGITPLVVMFMVKGSVAPTIAMAIYQRHSVAVNYLNFGFVMIVISITTVPILPRGQFLMNLFVSVFLTCLAASMVLLGQYAGIKARESTLPAGAPPQAYGTYNSSASAINAIFLMINIFGINVVKAARPALYIPSIQYTIFIMIGFTYGPNEPTEHLSLRFVKELLYTFLTGQAISAGVSLFIIPVSSRKVFFTEATGMLQSFRELMKAQLGFIEVLEDSGMCTILSSKPDSQTSNDFDASGVVERKAQYQKRSEALKASSGALLALSSKLHIDVDFAQREAAYGHLTSSDVESFYHLLRNVIIPISSLSTIADISERLRNHQLNEMSRLRKLQDLKDPSKTPIDALDDQDTQGEWRELVHVLHESFENAVQILDEAIIHVLTLLKLVPTREKATQQSTKSQNSTPESGTDNADVEKGNGSPRPGDVGFGDCLEKEISGFRDTRTAKLQAWAEEKGLSSVFHSATRYPTKSTLDHLQDPVLARERRIAIQLSLILYMEYLLWSVAKSTLALVRFAESKVEDGTMTKKRLIVPRVKIIYRWLRGVFFNNDSSKEIQGLDKVSDQVEVIRLGDSLKGPRDPEHLPPKNAWQRFGNHMRVIPRFLGSEPVHFGVRVTIATMSIGILAFLKNTHVFFIKQRVVWALVMVAIGMKPTSGSAIFNLACNLIFSVGGMTTAFINWYIVDGHTPGVIVFFALFMAFWFYWAAKFPRFLIGVVAGALTHVLIIGYELQVRVLGIRQATATGQPYYPVFELAPYRLLAVATGSFIAYIWTIFPVPITEGSVLRRDLGGSLFLLANYMSAVTATVDQRIENTEGDMTLKSSPGRRLQKMRGEVLDQQIALLNSMRQNLVDMSWEPPFGGDFPKHTYTVILKEIQDIIQYLTVIGYASDAFSNARLTSSTWLASFAESRIRSDRKSHKMTSLLALLSASIRNNQALPPYLQTPKQWHLSEQIKESNGEEVLGLKHINEPGFRALSVIEVASACAVDALGRIEELVRELVGEVDFSFQIAVRGSRESSDAGSSAGKVKAQ